jgi:aromatic ring-opening dioxygenase catalytic subunit (LigB family)
MTPTDIRMPTLYVPHGGGPWPFVDLSPFVAPAECEALADYLKAIPARLPRRPTALVVVSAHWEERVPTVMTSPRPPILYDYYGFPPEAYRIPWPAAGDRTLAGRVRELLEAAGIATGEDPQRGFDHGTFVPLKVSFPEADVPTIQLSLVAGLDPAQHLAVGKALTPLRDEGILLVGSGMSYHNLRAMQAGGGAQVAAIFDEWLGRVVASEASVRDAELVRWPSAPRARDAHPREEHLLPLMVVAGAAGRDRGRVAFRGSFAGVRISGVHFGD